MKRIVVNGAKSLQGEISVSGSKNAALPIIFACILTNGVSEIENLPDIGDVRVAIDIVRSFGAEVEKRGSITYIDTRRLSYKEPDLELVKAIRASTYLLGSCMSRFGRCHISSFGGCNFSLRPIDLHINACVALGGRLEGEMILCDRPHGSVILLSKASVGATVNSILLAAAADGETLIRGAAVEPHIDSLIYFINSCGGSVVRCGREIRIKGSELHGGRICVIGDMIEAGSYLALSLMTGGGVTVRNSPVEDMTASLDAFKDLGAEIIISDDEIGGRILSPRFLSVTAAPYPGFPTDLQPIIAPLMAQNGGGEITDTVWQTRFGYLEALSRFGVLSRVEQNRAVIYKSIIKSAKAKAIDLRGGMAALMCALVSKGQSEIYSAETILRGYEKLDEKLCAIGAEIKIEDI